MRSALKTATTQRLILTLALAGTAGAALALGACAPKKRPLSLKPVSPLIRSVELTEVGYTSTLSSLLLKINLGASEDESLVFDEISLFLDAACASPPLASATGTLAATEGLAFSAASDTSSQLYVQGRSEARGLTPCLFAIEYDPEHLPPGAPTLAGVHPASPSRITLQPMVRGDASPNTSTVKLFSDSQCLQEIASGSAQQFKSLGLQATVTANASTTIHGMAFEPFGGASPCTLLAQWRHDNIPPLAPVFTSSSPMSPTGTAYSPLIIGSARDAGSEGGATEVELFSDSSCLVEMSAGTAAAFSSTGVMASLADNATTWIYGRTLDLAGNTSACTLLTDFVHDSIAPAPPSLLQFNPPPPVRDTQYTSLVGSLNAGAADAVEIRLYDSDSCQTQIGVGTRQQWLTTGIQARLEVNTINTLHARSFDLAGNGSTCSLMGTFEHDSFPPDAASFVATVPASPNNSSTTPRIVGNAPEDAVRVHLYINDDACLGTPAASGTRATFVDLGIQIQAGADQSTFVYSRTEDVSGNRGDCTLLVEYQHDTRVPPGPAFVATNPASPNRLSTYPWVKGTVPPGTTEVTLYADSSCAVALSTGKASEFVNAGIRVAVAPNFTTQLHARTRNIFGNTSACTQLSDYTHDTIAPSVPVFDSTLPASPSTQSTTPLLLGQASSDTTQIQVFDDSVCANRIAIGSRSQFTQSGIALNLPANAFSEIYARSLDASQNASACTPLTTYLHDDIGPISPTFTLAAPASPSYSTGTRIRGNASTDTVSLKLYAGSGCTALIGTGTRSEWVGSGIAVTVPSNATSPIRAIAYDALLNPSACTLMNTFVHTDTPPEGVSSLVDSTGIVNLSWNAKSHATSYTVKRRTMSGAAFTSLASGFTGTSFADTLTSQGITYEYVVAADNSSGQTNFSAPIAATINVSLPAPVPRPTPTPGAGVVELSWTRPARAATFDVGRSLQPGGPYFIAGSGTSLMNFEATGLMENVVYYFAVRGRNSAGAGPWGPEVSVMSLPAPAGVSQIRFNSGADRVELGWDPPQYFTSFRVEYSYLGSNGPWLPAGLTTSPFFTHTGIDNDHDDHLLHYRVVTLWGKEEIVSQPVGPMWAASPPALSAAAGDQLITLTWSQVLGSSTPVEVERAPTATGPFVGIQSLGGGTSFTDSGISNGTTYYYRVRYSPAGTGKSGYSNIASSTPQATGTNPSNLTVGRENGAVTLRWTPGQRTNDYVVLRRSTPSGAPTAFGPITSLSYVDTAPIQGLNYYTVVGQWGGVLSGPSNQVSFRHSPAPNNLVATQGSNQISLSWAAVASTPAPVGYTVYRGASPNGPFATSFATATNSYTDTGLATGASHVYVVAARFSDGTHGPMSLPVGATTGSNVPAGVAVTSTTSNSLTLSWVTVRNATGYRVYRGSSSAGPWTLAATINSGATTQAMVTGITSNAVHFLTVAALSPSEGAKAPAISARTVAPPGAPSLTPGSGQISVAWIPVTGAASYLIERTQDAISYTAVQSAATGASWLDSSVSNGSGYAYRITAQFASGPPTLPSASSSFTFPGTIPDVPGSLSFTSITGSSVDLVWAPAQKALSYDVQQSTSSSGPFSTAFADLAATAVSFTGLTPGVPMHFRLISRFGNNLSAPSIVAGLMPMAPPAAPAATINQSGEVSLSWPAVPSAVSYRVERSTDLGQTFQLLGSSATTTLVDPTPGTSGPVVYRFKPEFSENLAAPYSSPTAELSPAIVPIAPVSLSAISSDGLTARLSWATVHNAADYILYRSTLSGGPWSSLGTTTQTELTDSSTVSGQTYYYVVRSRAASGRESPPSNEASISLSGAPGSLAAVAANGQNELSWTAVPGASVYRILKAVDPAGPFWAAASVAGTAWTDPDVRHGRTDYYSVSAEFPAQPRSPETAVASATGIVTLNLEVPIELTDLRLDSSPASGTSASDIRSESSLQVDPADYDGVVTWRWEVVAENTDSVSRTISLLNSDQVPRGSITLPAGTNSPVLIEAPLGAVPTTRETLTLALEQTQYAGNLKVHAARLRIQQVGASRTRLYFPLFSAQGPQGTLIQAPGNLSGAPFDWNELSFFSRMQGQQSAIAEGNALTLDALVEVFNGARGRVSLFNHNDAREISETRTDLSGDGLWSVSADFKNGVQGFGASESLHLYRFGLGCTAGCSAPTSGLRAVKAGLWVRHTDLRKVAVFYRAARSGGGSSSLVMLEPSRHSSLEHRVRCLATLSSSGTAACSLEDGMGIPISDASVTLENNSNTPSRILGQSTTSFSPPAGTVLNLRVNAASQVPWVHEAGVWVY